MADAVDFSFTEPFDAVFSNAALHWVTEAEQAVVCMAQALKQGGRFVVELGRQRQWVKIFYNDDGSIG